jgi:hypothetical protein
VTRGVQIALTNVISSEHEQAFNDWYDNVHIPATLRLSGFISAARYRIAENQMVPALADALGFRYLVIYEVDLDMLPAARSALPALVSSTPGFSSAALDPELRVAAFELVSQPSTAT